MPLGASARMTDFRVEDERRMGQPTHQIVPPTIPEADIREERIPADHQAHPGFRDQDKKQDSGERQRQQGAKAFSREELIEIVECVLSCAQRHAPLDQPVENRYVTQGDTASRLPYENEIPYGEPSRKRADAMRLAGLSVLPKTSALLNPFSSLKFRGKGDSKHLMRFLEQFENIARQEAIPDRDTLSYFGTCMVDKASGWWSLQRLSSYPVAKELFRQKFWNRDIQTKRRQALYTGKYPREAGISMSDYASERYLESVYFEPRMQELEIVEVLIRQFPPRVSLDLKAHEITTIDSLTRLDRLEDRYQDTGLNIYCMGDGQTVKTTSQTVLTTVPTGKERNQKKKNWGKGKPANTPLPVIPERGPSRESSPARSMDSGRQSPRPKEGHDSRSKTPYGRPQDVGIIDVTETGSYYTELEGKTALQIPLRPDEFGRPLADAAFKGENVQRDFAALIVCRSAASLVRQDLYDKWVRGSKE